MAWLNTLKKIDQGSRTAFENQAYYWNSGTGFYLPMHRSRSVTVYDELYVGGSKAAADALRDQLVAAGAYTDVAVIPAGAGQFHVSAQYKVIGAWSAWTYGWTPPEA